jgi:hypothetical protein
MKELFPEKCCFSDEARQSGGHENASGRNMMWYEQDSFGSGEGQEEGSCEHGKEPSGSIKCLKILE